MPRARALLHAVFGGWGVGQEVLEDAESVLSELVTNALRVPVPSDRRIGVRIARSAAEGLLRLEVSGAGGGRPEVREPGEDGTGGRGLPRVAALAHRWGHEERAARFGKTGFAELKAPDIVAEPATREVAAATVRTGQALRVRGEWRAVLGARSDPYAAGGPAVVPEPAEGPPLRVHAAAPLTLRTGECSG
ncbi:ATP-binding protein [Streptomyces sp. NEAU-W12]|uniref:ATP-binding protein n=1 Tax=Streptomyces sp. NEAU-W12 TaxID=2994668 RepID=UPI00224AB7F1|nr:ATP-binding protein [Streptomyces sp. NEAU-W12]MCX2923082.1 ATP-binding protein [Streptomyces sp. NEAU-W12]